LVASGIREKTVETIIEIKNRESIFQFLIQ